MVIIMVPKRVLCSHSCCENYKNGSDDFLIIRCYDTQQSQHVRLHKNQSSDFRCNCSVVNKKNFGLPSDNLTGLEQKKNKRKLLPRIFLINSFVKEIMRIIVLIISNKC